MSSSNSMNNTRLEGRVAIVTGGASGIGAATARLFLENGAKVVIADIQDELGRALVDTMCDNICYIHCDVSIEEQVRNLVDETVTKFGHLDIMYSNAGVYNNDFMSILDAQPEQLARILNINLIGGFLAAKHAARVMVPNKKGCIMFTASACTKIAGIAQYSYAASKYGIVGLTKSLSAELGLHGIRVNCISPFGVLTGSDVYDEKKKAMFEKLMCEVGNLKGKILRAEDVAKAAVYLASDEGSYVSAMNLVVDGGYSVANPSLFKDIIIRGGSTI
ncbi:(2R,3R)-2,3-butanediol dehydrogenase [Orobanche gracilis]